MGSHTVVDTQVRTSGHSSEIVKTVEDITVFENIKARLRTKFGEAIFDSWLARLDLVGLQGEIVHLSVPTNFLRSWLQSHYLDRIQATYEEDNPSIRRVSITVRVAGSKVAATTVPNAALAKATDAQLTLELPTTLPALNAAVTTPKPSLAFEGSPLDSKLRFETFQVGHGNVMAHTAVMQVVRAGSSDSPIYNPLYVHSAVGLGKTHLLQATAQAVAQSGRGVIYLTAEKFMYSFVTALRTQTALTFKENLRAVDLLIIDDVQFLNGKQTQQEFCHTLNALIDEGKQIIVAADRVPGDLETFDERLQSRLSGGLVIEIGPPDEALRLKVLETRIQVARSRFPGFTIAPDVLAHVAKCITTNGRDLEGAVNRLLARATLTGGSLDISTAEEAIHDLIKHREPRRVRIEDIQRLVANHYNVSRADILSSRRTTTVVRPRQIAMYLAKSLTLRSLPEIGRKFGGRDHTTVLHAVRKIDGLVTRDTSLAGEIDHLKRMLQE